MKYEEHHFCLPSPGREGRHQESLRPAFMLNITVRLNTTDRGTSYRHRSVKGVQKATSGHSIPHESTRASSFARPSAHAFHVIRQVIAKPRPEMAAPKAALFWLRTYVRGVMSPVRSSSCPVAANEMVRARLHHA